MPDVKLVMVGDGPLKADMELYTEQAGITEKVLFLGQRNDVPELLQAADLFVLPSLYEQLHVWKQKRRDSHVSYPMKLQKRFA